jgi:hypothetical protein
MATLSSCPSMETYSTPAPACLHVCLAVQFLHPRHCRLPLLPAPGAALSGYLTDCVCLTGLQIRQPLLDRERCWGRDCRAERGDHRRRRRRQSRPDKFLLLGGSWRRRRGSCSAAREVNELLGCGGDGSGWWCGVDAILLADRRTEWRERGAELSALLDPSGVATSCCDRGYDEPVGGGVPRSRPVYAQATHHTGTTCTRIRTHRHTHARAYDHTNVVPSCACTPTHTCVGACCVVYSTHRGRHPPCVADQSWHCTPKPQRNTIDSSAALVDGTQSRYCASLQASRIRIGSVGGVASTSLSWLRSQLLLHYQ